MDIFFIGKIFVYKFQIYFKFNKINLFIQTIVRTFIQF